MDLIKKPNFHKKKKKSTFEHYGVVLIYFSILSIRKQLLFVLKFDSFHFSKLRTDVAQFKFTFYGKNLVLVIDKSNSFTFSL